MQKERYNAMLLINVTNSSDCFYILAPEENTPQKICKINHLDYANILYQNTLFEKQQRKWNTQNLCNIKEIISE